MGLKSFYRKLVSPMVWGNFLAMAIVVALLFYGLVRWLGEYTHHGEGIEVPDFSGMSYSESVRRGDELGLVVVANDSTYNKRMPARSVVAQTPVAGANVKSGRIIYVTINSLTMPRLAIPDIVGNKTFREAEAQLLAMEFKLTEPLLVDTVFKDWVCGLRCGDRELKAGDMVAKESTLTLVIGSMRPDDDMELDEYAVDSFAIEDEAGYIDGNYQEPTDE